MRINFYQQAITAIEKFFYLIKGGVLCNAVIVATLWRLVFSVRLGCLY